LLSHGSHMSSLALPRTAVRSGGTISTCEFPVQC
jgi:hypothetical protein